MSKINGKEYAFYGKGSFKIDQTATKIKDFYDNEDEYSEMLLEFQNGNYSGTLS